MCILLCRVRRDNNGTISSAVQIPALGFGIKGNNMPYDLSATVHHTPRKSGSGHYTAICRSQNLQSHKWFMYNDDRVSPSKFTNMQKKHVMVLTCHMKTATILFYVSPSIETRINNAKTTDLMEVEKGQKQLVPSNGVKDSEDIDADGEEGDADGYSGDSNLHDEDEDDNKDDDEEKGESREVDLSSGDKSSGSYDSLSGTGSLDFS
jgi:hypothetical protein